jgi:hypothetical protein
MRKRNGKSEVRSRGLFTAKCIHVAYHFPAIHLIQNPSSGCIGMYMVLQRRQGWLTTHAAGHMEYPIHILHSGSGIITAWLRCPVGRTMICSAQKGEETAITLLLTLEVELIEMLPRQSRSHLPSFSLIDLKEVLHAFSLLNSSLSCSRTVWNRCSLMVALFCFD